MKHLLFVICLLSSTTAIGQMKFGIAAGTYVNFSGLDMEGWVGFDYLNDKHPVAGLMTGLIVERQMTNEISITSGLNYIQKTFKTEGGRYTLRNKLSYLNIPLKVKYTGQSPFFIAIGGGVSSNLKSFSEEWELLGEIGLNIRENVAFTIGYRQNLSYSGFLSLRDTVGQQIGGQAYKYRGWYALVSYLI